MTAPAVRFQNIVKRFPGVVALNGVSFDVHAGSCHAVCGENGAGKSTLGKILAGIHQQDEGEILLAGKSVRFASPRDAIAEGVAMVHQELAFCENLTVGDNLCLGQLPRKWGFVDHAALRERARRLLAAVGATIDPDRPMASLSVAEQQVVQIAAAVGEGAKVVVLDEPTSSLDEDESANLFRLIGDTRWLTWATYYMGSIYQQQGHFDRALATFEEARGIATTIGLSEFITMLDAELQKSQPESEQTYSI